ncbi:MAG TPA: PfkB family carbohydrate kinase [Solirubrobacteraceae bacterium]|jgi:sugar/nucleoside kinase (ribokinase family)
MSLTVVGSIAFDTVSTPFGSRERMLGGSAVHFALAASFFTDVRVVGPVGDDFGEQQLALLRGRGVATEDIERVPGGSTFFWRGHYDYDLNTAHTDETQLGVFGEFEPKLSAASRECDVLFLANIQPSLQREVREQCAQARFVALDSMNLWIDTAKDELLETIGLVDCLLLNDAELRMLTGKPSLAQAARELLDRGPRAVIAKRGEYGAALFTTEGFFALPAFPLETVVDPTGAGDSFAGGLLGAIAAAREEGTELDHEGLKRAMAYGTALASFNVEELGTDRVARLSAEEISRRVEELREITRMPEDPVSLRS